MFANRFRRTAIAVTGIATLVLAAACGGASSSTPGAGSATSAESAPAADTSGGAGADADVVDGGHVGGPVRPDLGGHAASLSSDRR